MLTPKIAAALKVKLRSKSLKIIDIQIYQLSSIRLRFVTGSQTDWRNLPCKTFIQKKYCGVVSAHWTLLANPILSLLNKMTYQERNQMSLLDECLQRKHWNNLYGSLRWLQKRMKNLINAIVKQNSFQTIQDCLSNRQKCESDSHLQFQSLAKKQQRHQVLYWVMSAVRRVYKRKNRWYDALTKKCWNF